MRTRNLLLCSAAGILSVTAAQAADLPVKAKPVEYVKVCSLYGAGFYYMPGTDLCLKIGGWVRAEAGWGYNGSLTWGPFAGAAFNRSTSNLVFRGRGYITADAREQTAYGTARGYIAVGVNTTDVGLNTAANQFSANRAFVQFAGITAGISQSFYDYYSVPATSYNGIYAASDTGDPGWLVFGYTAQLGNGLSATLSMEARRTTQIIDQNSLNSASSSPIFASGSGGSIVAGSYFDTLTASQNPSTSTLYVSGGAAVFPGNGAYGGQQIGDIVGNIRLDQAWGGAQIMGALHEVNATTYSTSVGGAPSVGFTGVGGGTVGHPSDAWGWAAGAGLRLNFPMIGQGDYFQAQVNATEGALRYIFFTPNSNWGKVDNGNLAYGVLSDCVYGGTLGTATTTSCQLTSAWGFNAAYEHHWSPAWQTSAYGGWDQVHYDTQANNMLCAGAGFGSGSGTGALAGTGCNNNWSTWFVGSRTQWNVSKTFYMGVDVMYEELNSASTGSAGAPLGYAGGTSAVTALGNATGTESHSSNWTVRFRAHKDFLP
ncbi:MAG: porin [Xanthobacteraceae bacterium]